MLSGAFFTSLSIAEIAGKRRSAESCYGRRRPKGRLMDRELPADTSARCFQGHSCHGLFSIHPARSAGRP